VVGPLRRLLVDPFKGVDTAKAYLQLLLTFIVRRPELIDGTREAFGELSLLSEI
jgi:hypothetical protein